MTTSRRRLLLAAGAALLPRAASCAAPSPFGVASFSYQARLNAERGLRDPLRFLRFCRERGAGGAQIAIPAGDAAELGALRRYLDDTGMWLEGSVRLPRDAADLPRFDADVQAAKSAGATVLRTVMLSGRRYESFATAEDFRRFRETSAASVRLAAPVVERRQMRLALENHKDYRAEELIDLLRKLASPAVGVTVDTGNSIALLEQPLETVEALAPWAFSVHLKDMAIDEHRDGFLLSEVPFGQGFLDLPALVAALRKRRPEVRFSIEMATRDPLLVPCLTERYWATFDTLPGGVLARMLALVRERKEGRPLPRVATLSADALLRREDENVRLCLAYAARRLAADPRAYGVSPAQ